MQQSAEGFERIRQLRTILIERLQKGSTDEIASQAGRYASERPTEEFSPRFRHRFLHGSFKTLTETFLDDFGRAMNDDLNAPQALAALFCWVRGLNAANIESSTDISGILAVYRCLLQHLWVLGIEWPDTTYFPELAAECMPQGQNQNATKPFERILDLLVEERQRARCEKDFKTSDLIRDLLAKSGVAIEDTPAGPRWKLEK